MTNEHWMYGFPLMPNKAAQVASAPHNKELRWKLVEARCKQFGEAVGAARLPLMIALTWSFLSAWALFANEYGYLVIYKARYEYFHTLAVAFQDHAKTSDKKYSPTDQYDIQKFKSQLDKFCSEIGFGPDKTNPIYRVFGHKFDEKFMHDQCFKRIEEVHNDLRKDAHSATYFTPPGGLSKISYVDIGIMGNIGLILILAWAYFAAARENHLTKSFVDTRARFFRGDVLLEPQDPDLSTEHYSYAYYVGAERFVLMFSQHARPMLLVSAAFIALPALVASAHLLTNYRDFRSLDWERDVASRMMLEVILTGIVIAITAFWIRLSVETSRLLNLWHLAVKDVWGDPQYAGHLPTPPVNVDLPNQKAVAAAIPVRRSKNENESG